jgi:tRNA(His) 5'-end guanylyltransferase
MKSYEGVAEGSLMAKSPVILRVDGKAFSTFTKGMQKPVDESLEACMLRTAESLCRGIDGAKLAYVQSDEISILVTDWASLSTQSYFGYRTQKVVSVVASTATAAFNKEKNSRNFLLRGQEVAGSYLPPAIFDCRAFNVPPHEVVNYFIWRQQDATRNSVSSLAQANFSHKSLQNKGSGAMQEMLFAEKGINWNDCPTGQKRGFCVVKKTQTVSRDSLLTPPSFAWKAKADARGGDTVERSYWSVDEDIPVFTQDRAYIQDLLTEGVL